MRRLQRWRVRIVGLALLSLTGLSAAAGERHEMMRPRVPADNLPEARALANPLSESAEVIQSGKALYEGRGGCVKCHGITGQGDGEASAGLNPPPRNFRHHGFWRHRSEGEIFWVVKNGSPGTAMIPFGSTLSDEEIWSIIRYEQTFAGGHGRRGRMGSSEGMGRRGGMRGSGSESECVGRGCGKVPEDDLTRP